MTLTIEIPDEDVAAVSAKAQTLGLSPKQYARQSLERDEVRAKLPSDSSSSIGLTGCIPIETMRRHNIVEAFTNDRPAQRFLVGL